MIIEADLGRKKELHLCVVMSDSYLDIYQKVFNRTLPREFASVNILHIRDYDSTPGAVGDHHFKIINYKRLHFVAQQMKLHEGDNLLVMDLDVVCFRDFKDEINSLLETNDMVFQSNPHYPNMPYCIATWGLQCSRKNINFFKWAVLPKANSLLFTAEYWNQNVGKPVPTHLFHFLNGEQAHHDGDACVVNSAILESELGQELKIGFLPDTYTQDPEGGTHPDQCVLYQSAGNAQSIQEKAEVLVNAHTYIREKIDFNKGRSS